MCALVLLAASLTFGTEDADLAWRCADTIVRDCTPRDSGTIRGQVAANRILDLASETGADVRQDVFFDISCGQRRRFVNVCAEFRFDPQAPWIVILSHFDTKHGIACAGANDGASTSGILIALAGRLAALKGFGRNVLLVWTDGEECRKAYDDDDGLHGSRRAVEYVRERKYPVAAVLCLDMLGDRDLHVSVPANGSASLARVAESAARKAGFPGLVVCGREHVRDDHVPFLQAGYAAIDLIDLSYGPDNSYWHTGEDSMKNVSKASLYKSGRLVVEIANILAEKGKP